ncbi:hypothetical protein FACS1894176_06170 [Bacteroidia bacterium]|nr:hypothetical protein FACS1894176_06170 [Bacteroidia bacterium]
MNFLNPEGIYVREGLSVSGGVLFLGQGALTGKIITSQIEPASMRYRDHLALDTTTPSGSKVAVSLLDCDTEQPLVGWNQVPYLGSPLSLTGINKTTYACLYLQVEVERNDVTDPSPILSKMDLDWQPFPILMSKVGTTMTSAEACNNIQYQVNFSNNYVNDMGVVVSIPLPRAERGTITDYDT